MSEDQSQEQDSTGRPDYVHCVRTGAWNKPEDQGGQPETTSWCGRETRREFAFVDPTHAVLNAKADGRLLICPECSTAILEQLKKQTWTK